VGIGTLTQKQTESVLTSIHPSTELKDVVAEADVVIEAVLGHVHTNQCIGDESEIDKEHEYYVELIESRENSPIALEPAEKPFHLISLLIHLPIVFPRKDSVRLGWHHWSHAKIHDQLTSFIPLIGPIHDNEVGLQIRGL